VSDRIEKILAQGKREHEVGPPATSDAILKLTLGTNLELPAAYIEFLQTHDGGRGELPVQPCWYELWPAIEVLENNENYEVATHLPKFFAIGSNQGGELIYIDYREGTKGNVVSIPLIPTDPEYAKIIARSFEELIPLLGKECDRN
jgi:cell wall assembly regulator SMI1